MGGKRKKNVSPNKPTGKKSAASAVEQKPPTTGTPKTPTGKNSAASAVEQKPTTTGTPKTPTRKKGAASAVEQKTPTTGTPKTPTRKMSAASAVEQKLMTTEPESLVEERQEKNENRFSAVMEKHGCSMDIIRISTATIRYRNTNRALHPGTLTGLREKMKQQGFSAQCPIMTQTMNHAQQEKLNRESKDPTNHVKDMGGNGNLSLVNGGHRLAIAMELGLDVWGYVLPSTVPEHSILELSELSNGTNGVGKANNTLTKFSIVKKLITTLDETNKRTTIPEAASYVGRTRKWFTDIRKQFEGMEKETRDKLL
eukprot:gene5590-336_t